MVLIPMSYRSYSNDESSKCSPWLIMMIPWYSVFLMMNDSDLSIPSDSSNGCKFSEVQYSRSRMIILLSSLEAWALG